MIPIVKNHEEQGIGRLLQQFKGKPNIEAILKAYLNQVQITEDDILTLLGQMDIDEATGAQLDNIGKIVGIKRGGRSDSSFKDAIKLQILINTGEGTPNDILQILSLITNATVVKVFNHFPLGSNLYTNGDYIPKDLPSTLLKSAPIAHGEIQIYQETTGKSLIPVELVRSTGILIDNDGNEVVDNNGNNIIVGGLGGELLNEDRAILSELDDSIDEPSIPLEVYN